MAVADDTVKIAKKPRKISGEVTEPGAVTLNGPVKTPATALFSVPSDSDFGNIEFLESSSLRVLAVQLISEHKTLNHLSVLTNDLHGIRFFWKRRGGQHKGKCAIPSGLLGSLTNAAFIVWLAADHCQGWMKRDVEALMYHYLRHAAFDQGRARINKHDVEAFASEVEYYGLWQSNLREFGKAVRQLSLDDAAL